MDRGIFLDYRVGEMTSEDSVISVGICFAPYDEILPLVTGVFRTFSGPAVVIPNARESPHQYCEQDRKYADKAKSNFIIPLPGILISEPEGTTGITLVEHWGHDKVFDNLGKLRSGMTSVLIHSVFGTKTNLQHMFKLSKGTKVIRYVSLSRGLESTRWSLEETGEAQPWEDIERYKVRATSRRLDRALLFDYAKEFSVDLQACLAHRRLKRSAYIKSLSFYDPDDSREPAKFGQAAYEAALKAGIGEPELAQPAAERQEWAAMMQDNMDFSQAAYKALNKAKSIDNIMAAVHSAKVMLGMGEEMELSYWGLFPVILDRAYTIDMEHLSVRRLECEWIEFTKGTDWPVSREDIKENRTEARRWNVLGPMAKRHDLTMKSAEFPGDLLEILHDVSRPDIPEIDHRFRETAVANAFRAACLLDPNAPATDELGRALNVLHSELVGREVDLASAVREQQFKLLKRREAAARKRAEKASKSK